MKLEKVFEGYGYNIDHSGRHTWDCFPNGIFVQLKIDKYVDMYVDFYYNYKTHDVYSIEVVYFKDEVTYQWNNPKTHQAYIDESNERGYDMVDLFDKPHIIVDDVDIFDLIALKLAHYE